MATNRIEGAKGGAEGGKAEGENGAGGGAAAAAGGGGGGAKAWLPLILNLVLMPVLAYAMTMFVLVPKVTKSVGATTEAESSSGESGSHGKSSGSSEKGKEGHGGKVTRITVPLSKQILVNVKGSSGARYIQANISLVGEGEKFKEQIEKEDMQLRAVAGITLGEKTILDIEKPGAKQVIRTELMTAFSTALGKDGPKILDLYLTDFAIQ